MIDFSTEGLYNTLIKRPHIVILGAGATMAAIPNGDRFGNKSSVMNNFIQNLGLDEILNKANLNTQSNNFEDIYSEIDSRSDSSLLKVVLDNRVKNYFAGLTIPDKLTIYDYLLISLRKKDFIFSFNWDPLIIQAYRRVSRITHDLPNLVFLHGNVGMKICDDCQQVQSVENEECVKCGKSDFSQPKILFPVKDKDYTSDRYIKMAWEAFLEEIASCTYLTIFGYSAPKSDVKAIEAMQLAFKSNFRRFDSIEIIDIADEDVIYDSWAEFIHTTNDHYKIVKSFWDSILTEFPRRSVEGYCKRNIKGWWGGSNRKLSECSSISELEDMVSPIIDEENRGNFDTL